MQVVTPGCVKRDILLVNLVCAEIITEIHRQTEFLCKVSFFIINWQFMLYPDLFAYNLGSVIKRLGLK